MSEEQIKIAEAASYDELTDFEKKCFQFKHCEECGCPTEESDFEYAECVEDEDFLREQTHHGVCSRLIEVEID